MQAIAVWKKLGFDAIDLIEEKFLIDLKNIKNTFVKDNLAALGFMLANGNLEIKIAI